MSSRANQKHWNWSSGFEELMPMRYHRIARRIVGGVSNASKRSIEFVIRSSRNGVGSSCPIESPHIRQERICTSGVQSTICLIRCRTKLDPVMSASMFRQSASLSSATSAASSRFCASNVRCKESRKGVEKSSRTMLRIRARNNPFGCCNFSHLPSSKTDNSDLIS